ncbi:hypothetical protein BK816_07455 [Boudabousia tangfeifanii]|uniref:Uncharacterized protein n=1 Tax=Boudabousia tangfeifanii TaxID=1912795 RepID=A0A1D9MLH0_9ACTO|nr:hypothetical protein [Boudabousia tangfeifanii]AOZ73147.1 hypothetical protein BK816_07455 [Boudabousia tangfeifanii]
MALGNDHPSTDLPGGNQPGGPEPVGQPEPGTPQPGPSAPQPGEPTDGAEPTRFPSRRSRRQNQPENEVVGVTQIPQKELDDEKAQNEAEEKVDANGRPQPRYGIRLSDEERARLKAQREAERPKEEAKPETGRGFKSAGFAGRRPSPVKETRPEEKPKRGFNRPVQGQEDNPYRLNQGAQPSGPRPTAPAQPAARKRAWWIVALGAILMFIAPIIVLFIVGFSLVNFVPSDAPVQQLSSSAMKVQVSPEKKSWVALTSASADTKCELTGSSGKSVTGELVLGNAKGGQQVFAFPALGEKNGEVKCQPEVANTSVLFAGGDISDWMGTMTLWVMSLFVIPFIGFILLLVGIFRLARTKAAQ